MARYRGYVEPLRHTIVHGWIFDDDDPGRRIVVAVFADGLFVSCTVANRFRADLASAGIGDGCHAYELDLSGKIVSVEHTLVLSVANHTYELESIAPLDFKELNTRLAARIDSQSELVADPSMNGEYLAELTRLAIAYASGYQTAAPFPFSAFDEFLPVQIAKSALRDFPNPKALNWSPFSDGYTERKLAFGLPEQLSPVLRALLGFFNSRPFLQFLEILTGIDGLVPDPYYMGGGLHQIERGGKLAIHADFNRHPKLRLDRRINLLLYLNEDWREEYGGHLELWKRDMSAAAERILPVFNRCVIFNTTEWSYHGHPDPLTCPENRTRKSIAIYYYTNGRPEEERAEPHLTLWQERPAH